MPDYSGFAEKVGDTSAKVRQSEAVYEYCKLKPGKQGFALSRYGS